MKTMLSSVLEMLDVDPAAGDDLAELMALRRRLKELISSYRSFGFEALAQEYEASLVPIDQRISALRSHEKAAGDC